MSGIFFHKPLKAKVREQTNEQKKSDLQAVLKRVDIEDKVGKDQEIKIYNQIGSKSGWEQQEQSLSLAIENAAIEVRKATQRFNELQSVMSNVRHNIQVWKKLEAEANQRRDMKAQLESALVVVDFRLAKQEEAADQGKQSESTTMQRTQYVRDILGPPIDQLDSAAFYDALNELVRLRDPKVLLAAAELPKYFDFVRSKWSPPGGPAMVGGCVSPYRWGGGATMVIAAPGPVYYTMPPFAIPQTFKPA